MWRPAESPLGQRAEKSRVLEERQWLWVAKQWRWTAEDKQGEGASGRRERTELHVAALVDV